MTAVPAAAAAIAPSRRSAPVIHVARDDANTARWIVRREGDLRTHRFADRRQAADFARAIGRAAGGYRLFLELRDGRVLCEMLNVA